MYLQDLAKVIYTSNTLSELRKIVVMTYGKNKKVLWEGDAKDLQNWDDIKDWIVVEVLVNDLDDSSTHDYNKGKIITVV